MDYFCYISRTKVDQLLENFEPSQTDSWKELRSNERGTSSGLEGGLGISGILNLFKGNISYGRKGIVQIEKEVKRHYLEKLRSLIETLIADEEIAELSEKITRESRFEHLYYHYTGRFFCEEFDEKNPKSVVTISSELQEPVSLSLDCSVRFFSESNSPAGEFLIHSANSRFFSGDIPLRFETVFLYLHHSEKTIFGTPLFLKLHADDGLLFTRI